MAIPLIVNGSSFNYPETGDTNWGSQATLWASAVTTGMLQKAGGAFTLTAEVDFGATYGTKQAYIKTQTANVATAGFGRLARTDVVSWRNQANSSNLDLGVSSSNTLQFNGEDITTGLITNADIDAAAAIAFSKMAALTVSRALVSDASGVVTVSAALATEVAFLSGVTSAIQTQITARLQLAGGTMIGALVLAADPATAFQAATKQYVDNLVTGLQPKTQCRLASTANVVIASALENGDTLDGATIATGDRILLKNQTLPAENGIYIAPASGAASRATDMDTWTETLQAYIFITAGTANTATGWVSQSAAGGTIGVTALNFVQFLANTAYTADGQGLELTGSQFALELDGATLSKSASGVKVNQIANAQIAAAAAIAVNKLAALTASRAVVSDGSGFLAASAVTATTLAFLDATSSVQTQLDAKIPKSVMTTDGDIITRAAGVPARVGAGTSNEVLTIGNSGGPEWLSQQVSFTAIRSTAASYTIATSWTALTLSAPYAGENEVTRSGNSLTDWPTTGLYRITVEFSNIEGPAANRDILVRLRNTTQSTTLDYSITDRRDVNNNRGAFSCTLVADIATARLGDDFEIQAVASGASCIVTQATVSSQASALYKIVIEKIYHLIIE